MNTADSTEELSDDNDVAEFYRISTFLVLFFIVFCLLFRSGWQMNLVYCVYFNLYRKP
jgi:hypothetical protein